MRAQRKEQGGSVVIATLLIAVVVAMLCGSYLTTVIREQNFSMRSLKANSALNLAEAGIDAAMFDLKKKQVPGTAWTAEMDEDEKIKYYHRTLFTNRDLGSADVGSVSVIIENYSPGVSNQSPVITSQGRIRHPNQPEVIKQVRVTLKAAASNPAVGVISKETINMNGQNVVFDAYDSALGDYKAPVPAGSKAAIGTVGTTNVTDGVMIAVLSTTASIAINKDTVYGKVAFAGASARGADNNFDDRITWQGDNGNGGALYGADTKGVSIANNGRVTAIFDKTKVVPNNDIVLPPAPPTPDGTGATAGTTIAQPKNKEVLILGYPNASPDNPTYYYMDENLSLQGNETQIKVVGPVVLVLKGDLSISGNKAGISIENSDETPNASLTLFVKNNININGQGIANNFYEADRFYLIPYGDKGQNISLGGNGTYRGVFYGPTFNANINGNGAWYGAIVANAISITGNGGFHFDEQSGKRLSGTTGFSIDKWVELTNIPGTTYRRDTRAPF